MEFNVVLLAENAVYYHVSNVPKLWTHSSGALYLPILEC